MIKLDDDNDDQDLSINQIAKDIKDLESSITLNNNDPVEAGYDENIVGYGDCCGDLPQRVSELEERMDKIEDWAEKFENRVTSTLAKMRKTQINYELED